MHSVLFSFSLLIIISTLIPFIRHDFWIFRVFEYPRLQKLALNLVLVGVIFLFDFPKTTVDLIIIVVLLLNLFYLLYLIIPFTIFGKKQIIDAKNKETSATLKLFIGNVFQENRKANEYLTIISECKPDVVLLVETDLWWQQEMDFLSNDYPHQVKIPLENTYGMLLYSKYQLIDGQVNYLVKSDIPSIETLVKLPSGQLIKLFCLHPEPPVPQENPRSTERDKEILLVANKAKVDKYPVIVMGDLNDVAWSYTTELFGKISGLLDPRRGRGFFNSFNANYFFLRFPLDHIFCSTDFTLNAIKRLENCGSDHFPMCVELQHNPKAESQNEKPQATQEDLELAEEKVNAEVE
jgi:endonuclease/exonuclease/phosphatase (EEP) superfamily protein YafD